MISQSLATMFLNAARALATGAKDTGYTSNGLRKLDFKLIEGGKPKVFTAIQQNPDKLSTPAKLAREGHQIIQIRDNEEARLVGNVDVTENRFNSYENIPNPVDISEVEQALGSHAARQGEVQITAARTATPVGSEPGRGESARGGLSLEDLGKTA